MATSKEYIGNGKTTKHNGVQVSIRMEEAEKFLRKAESGTWLNFIVSPRQQVDKYGRTHTVFVLVDQPEATPEQKPAENAVAEPGTPIGETREVNGKKLKRISKAEAAKRKAEQAAAA